ncbi:MAG: DUF424 family protein [Candidatus Thermoplasmatota archaeon]|nr:DUF424 family protein [Candidatus Thermoplasmatota archaeon]
MSQKGDDTSSPANNICLKTYVVGRDLMVAACDRELLGQTLSDGDVELVVLEDFYCSVYGDVELLTRHLERATIANLVGERCVACGMQMGLIEEEKVLNIANVPHAQFALMI